MSGSLSLAALLGGVQIWDWDDPEVRRRACEISPMLCDVQLKHDEIFVSMHTQSILVGEQSHFLYVLHKNALLQEAREAAREHIRKEAERILGEPWKLSDEE